MDLSLIGDKSYLKYSGFLPCMWIDSHHCSENIVNLVQAVSDFSFRNFGSTIFLTIFNN